MRNTDHHAPKSGRKVVRRTTWLVTIIVTGMLVPLDARAEDDVIDIASRRELFLDHDLIDRLDGVRLVMHHPRQAGVAMKFDKPWEGAFCGYVTVIQDRDLYRLYYRGLPRAGKDGSSAEVTCYAESPDGIHWSKPELGLFEVAGTRRNNVILADAAPCSHNFAPFLDTRPGVPQAMRYKAVGGTRRSGLIPFVSRDGVHWTKLRDEPILTRGAFDSQNVIFWSASEKQYVCYLRTFKNGVRWIARATSEDFLHWTSPTDVSFGGAPAEHLYTNQTRPYFRAPHLYVSIAARFWPGRRVLSPEQARERGVDSGYFNDCSDCVLMTTRGGLRFDRTFLESFVRPGLGLGNWVSRTNYPACGVVPTGPSEMSLYVQKDYAQPTHRLVRYTLRTDGFVSVNAPYAGGEFITKPVRFLGNELAVNVATSAAGGIRVEVQTADGKAIEGYTFNDCQEIIGDEIERVVAWTRGTSVAKLAGQPVRLRFRMKDADLYALRFQ